MNRAICHDAGDAVKNEIAPYLNDIADNPDAIVGELLEGASENGLECHGGRELSKFSCCLVAEIVRKSGEDRFETALAGLRITTRDMIAATTGAHAFALENNGRPFMALFMQVMMFAASKLPGRFDKIAAVAIEFLKARPGRERECLQELLWMINHAGAGRYEECMSYTGGASPARWFLHIAAAALGDLRARSLAACFEAAAMEGGAGFVGNPAVEALSGLNSIGDESFCESVRSVLEFSGALIRKTQMSETERARVVETVCALPGVREAPVRVSALMQVLPFISGFSSLSEIAWFVETFAEKCRDAYKTLAASLLESSVSSIEEFNGIVADRAVALLPAVTPMVFRCAATNDRAVWADICMRLIAVGPRLSGMPEEDIDAIAGAAGPSGESAELEGLLKKSPVAVIRAVKGIEAAFRNNGLTVCCDAASEIKRLAAHPKLLEEFLKEFPGYVNSGVLGKYLERTGRAVDFYLLQNAGSPAFLRSPGALRRYVDAPSEEKAIFMKLLDELYRAALYGEPPEDERDMAIFEEFEASIASYWCSDADAVADLKELYDASGIDKIVSKEHSTDMSGVECKITSSRSVFREGFESAASAPRKFDIVVSRRFLDALILSCDRGGKPDDVAGCVQRDFVCARIIDPAARKIAGAVKLFMSRSGSDACLIATRIRANKDMLPDKNPGALWQPVRRWMLFAAAETGCKYAAIPAILDKTFSESLSLRRELNPDIIRGASLKLDRAVKDGRSVTVKCTILPERSWNTASGRVTREAVQKHNDSIPLKKKINALLDLLACINFNDPVKLS